MTLWDTFTWQPVRSFEVESYSSGTVSLDGRLLAVGTVTGAVCWRDAETGEPLATPSRPTMLVWGKSP